MSNPNRRTDDGHRHRTRHRIRSGDGRTRRRVLASIAAGSGIVLAGCIGGGSSGNGSNTEGGSAGDSSTTEGDSSNDGTTTEGDSSGNGSGGGDGDSYEATLQSEVDGLEIVSAEYTDTGIQGRFPVTATVKNTGDQETDSMEYAYEHTVFDGSDSDITGGSSHSSENPMVAPGETTEVRLTTIVDGDPENVARYEVVVDCHHLLNGVYCGGSGSDGTSHPADDTEETSQEATAAASGETVPFTLKLNALPEGFESLVVSIGSVTLDPFEGNGQSVELDGGGTTVDLTQLDDEPSDPVLDAAPVPIGSYGTLSMSVSIEEATLSGGGSADVQAGTIETDLALFDDPAQFEAGGNDASLTMNLMVGMEPPYELSISGWGGTGI